MKKYIAALIILLMLPVTVFAHSGDTDRNTYKNDDTSEVPIIAVVVIAASLLCPCVFIGYGVYGDVKERAKKSQNKAKLIELRSWFEGLTRKLTISRTLVTKVAFVLIVILLFQLFSFLSLRNSMLKQMDRDIEEIYETNHPMSKITVYITNTGEKYHASNCQYLHSSRHKTTLRKAVLSGYSKCSKCSTPPYISNYNGIDTREEYIEAGHLDDLLEDYKARVFIIFRVIPTMIGLLIIAIPVFLIVIKRNDQTI